MSLITRAQTARAAAADLAAQGPGLLKHRERALHDAVRQFVSRAMSLPDHIELPPAERDELQQLIGATVETIERYLARPGEHGGRRTDADRKLVEAVYALKDAEEQVSQRKRFAD
ncbi:MAG: hypothetical protein EPO35_10530 [Acidobacteria bacterium]|nr:MAG: hypothetical protein EPO35_10530 [Acidobacteriota bacterium]